ncbi:MAG: hypothetical protein K9L65_05000, partial [Chromatiaceae bacterium]|nr:hypothetical protein [Chromatiaceae bacterium]
MAMSIITPIIAVMADALCLAPGCAAASAPICAQRQVGISASALSPILFEQRDQGRLALLL